MSFVYVLVVNGAEWEDLVVYLTKAEAIEKSLAWPNTRVEIFAKSSKGGYRPTYCYYLAGAYVKTDLPSEDGVDRTGLDSAHVENVPQ